MTLVALIADAGAEAGFGHLSRCSALASALRRRGASVRALGLGLRVPIERYGISWQPAVEPGVTGVAAVVIDSYRLGEELRTRLAELAPLIVFADDNRRLSDATLVIRSGSPSGGVEAFAGPRYACLGPEYWWGRSPRMSANVERVLVATGAGDHTGIGAVLASRVSGAIPGSEVTLVRGPYAPANSVEGVRTIVAPDSMFGPLTKTDMLVSAAGQTMLESLAVGTPCVALVTAENQRRQAIELQKTGALSVATSVEKAVAVACSLAGDFDARREQARIGRRVVDGQGAMRVAAAVLELALRRCLA